MGVAPDLAGRVAFVTGAAGGIGLGIATVLALEGMKIALADVDSEELARAADGLRAAGADVATVVLDVRDRQAWTDAVKSVGAALGPIHVLCNNAGVSTHEWLTQMPPENWDWIIGVNLTGVYNGIAAVVPGMIAAGAGGHIVNTSSMAGLHPAPGYPIGAYAATKAGVVALSESLRSELEAHDIGVSVLCPGLVDTRIRRTSAEQRPTATATQPPPPGAMATSAVPGPLDVGARVLAGLRRNAAFIITHPEMRPAVVQHCSTILNAFDDAADDTQRSALPEQQDQP